MGVQIISKQCMPYKEATRILDLMYEAHMVVLSTGEICRPNACTEWLIKVELNNPAFYNLMKAYHCGVFFTLFGYEFYTAEISADYFIWLANKDTEEYYISKTRVDRTLAYYGARINSEYEKEADFLAKTKEFCELIGEDVAVVREANASKNGVADLLLCYMGRFVACELKAIKGTPSPQQLKFIDKIRKAGGQASVCRSLSDVWNLMQRTAPGT